MNSVLSIPQMIALEQRAFAEGVDAWALMQEVAAKAADAILARYPAPAVCRVFAGKGNNGGDAWLVAGRLARAGWSVEVTCPFSAGEMSELERRAAAEWPAESVRPQRLRNARRPSVVVDGLLGIGAKGELRAPMPEMIREMASLRARGAEVFALDLPSGLGTYGCVVADHTLTAGFAKDVLLTDEATHFVGRISVLPLSELSRRMTEQVDGEIATAENLGALLPPRAFDIHKGNCGRVTVVAGSAGTAGAAVLAAFGALRGGAGLVSLFCPPEIYPTLAPMLPPEVMARPWTDLGAVALGTMDVLAVGPGLATEWTEPVWTLLEAARVPMVLDAGALSIVAGDMDRLRKLSGPLLLTPHPGEMERLFPRENRSRAEWAAAFVSQPDHEKMTLLLKGARTVVAGDGYPLSYNITGHPGMATGGMGDTLTGVCAALIAQGLTTRDAARVGAWVCGRAAELAIRIGGQSQESLLPTDLSAFLGQAFSDLRAGLD